MSGFYEKLAEVKAQKFPPNICKFMKIWRDKGDKDLYVEVIEEGVWILDPVTGEPAELKDAAKVLTEVLGFPVTQNDIWKHRHSACATCKRIREAGYVLG